MVNITAFFHSLCKALYADRSATLTRYEEKHFKANGSLKFSDMRRVVLFFGQKSSFNFSHHHLYTIRDMLTTRSAKVDYYFFFFLVRAYQTVSTINTYLTHQMHWCYFVCLELDLFSELACGGSLKGKDGGGMPGADGRCCCGCKGLRT